MKNYLMNATLLLSTFLSASSSIADADSYLQKGLGQQLEILTKNQDRNGAFYPESCSNKAMTRGCFNEQSIFMSALIAESLLESHSKLKSVQELTLKTVSYLDGQVTDQNGPMGYFEKRSNMHFLARPDVDDNVIIFGTLNKAGLEFKQAEKVYDEILKKAKIHPKLKEKEGKELLSTDYLATWVKHSKPFFNDIDLAVNANALFGIGNLKSLASKYQTVSQPICEAINTVIGWSNTDELNELENVRHWYLLKKRNYSQWYPSKYTTILSIVRGYLDSGRPKCIEPAIQRIKKHLLSKTEYGNVYDQALASVALKRLLIADHEATTSLQERAKVLMKMFETESYGKRPFFFYGVIGYIGSLDYPRALAIELLSTVLSAPTLTPVLRPTPSPSATAPTSTALTPVTQQRAPSSVSLDYFKKEQQRDGSFTKMIIPSSILYNTYMIMLYEYLGLTEAKQDKVTSLKEHLFTQQKSDGSFAGYSEGVDDLNLSVLAYVTSKIAGEDENSARMKKLEDAINKMGGAKKAGFLSVPMLALFNLNRDYKIFEPGMTRVFMKMNKKLPWLKVLLYPLAYLYEAREIHELSDSKFPKRLFEKRLKEPKERNAHVGKKFFKWALNRMNTDGTFFDYTPTTVPMLMALSSEKEDDNKTLKYAEIINKGVATLESFQIPTEKGLMQTSGEASIGETFYIANALLDMGVPHDNEIIAKSEKFLLATRQERTGAWGFSKHNIYFPDTDDTSNVIYLLQRLHIKRGKTGMNPDVAKGLDWLLDQQNRDGGFGTWQKTPGHIIGPFFNKFGKKKGIVIDESVMEHTSRIIVSLAALKPYSNDANKAYEKALKWLISMQNEDGSFDGTWFIDYLFGTSMAITALSADPNPSPEAESAIQKAIAYIVKNQHNDGGFGESPDSFREGKAISLATSSPAQTGLIGTQLLTTLKLTSCKHYDQLREPIRKMKDFLTTSKKTDGMWEDNAWTAVTFPKLEYLIYPYVQAVAPLQALTMAELSECK